MSEFLERQRMKQEQQQARQGAGLSQGAIALETAPFLFRGRRACKFTCIDLTMSMSNIN